MSKSKTGWSRWRLTMRGEDGEIAMQTHMTKDAAIAGLEDPLVPRPTFAIVTRMTWSKHDQMFLPVARPKRGDDVISFAYENGEWHE